MSRVNNIVFLLFSLTLLFGTLCKSEMYEVQKIFTDIDPNFKGIVFNCDPTCAFLAVRQDKIWSPDLTQSKNKVYKINPQLISTQDPIYPILILQSPIAPFIQALNKADNQNKDKKSERVLKPPKTEFDYGYEVKLGLKANTMKIESSSNIQSNLSPQNSLIHPSVSLGLYRAKPFNLFSQWFQFQIYYTIDSSADSKTQNNFIFKYNESDIFINSWLLKDEFKFGLAIANNTTNIETSENIISSYSTNEDWTSLSLLLNYHRYLFGITNGLTLKIYDNQNFRTEIKKADLLKLYFQWCSSSYEVVDINFGICGGAEHVSKKITTNTISNTENQINSSQFKLTFSLRFGDDFYK